MAKSIDAPRTHGNLHVLYGIAKAGGDEDQSNPVRRPCSVALRLRIWRERKLSLLARDIAILIVDRSALREGACTMGLDAIAEVFGAHRRSVDRALGELRGVGWLTTERRGRGHPSARWIVVT